MNSDHATRGQAAAAQGVRYLPGEAVAVVTADSVLLVARDHGDMGQLLEEVAGAEDARSVLIAAAGGSVLDLGDLPDLALAHRGPGGLRVLLSGRTRCTVEDGGAITELDGAEVALLGEWGFSADAIVDLAVHGAAEGEPSWPVTGGVVQAGRVRWVAGAAESMGGSSSSSSSSLPLPAPAPAPDTAPTPAPSPEPEPAPAPASTPAPASADATLLPDATIDPVADSTLGAAPAATPAAVPAGGDDGELDDVSYTIGGGIDYDRVFNPAVRPSAAASAFAPPAESDPEVSPESESESESESAQSGVAPDLGGDTISPEAAAAMRASAGAAPIAAEGRQTVARLCPQNHANPPQLSACRICQAPLDGPTVRIARPSLGVVRLSTGMFFDLDRPLLLGREPRIDGVDADSAPRLIVLPSPDKAISRSHLRVDIDGWSVHAVDLGSVNGTYLRRGAAEEVRLMPDEPKMLMAGDVLVIDDVRIRFEDLP